MYKMENEYDAMEIEEEEETMKLEVELVENKYCYLRACQVMVMS